MTQDCARPTIVPNITEASFIAAGPQHTAVCCSDGRYRAMRPVVLTDGCENKIHRLYTTGQNPAGELGVQHGASVNGCSEFQLVVGSGQGADCVASTVSCGASHTICIDASGQLWGCGSNLNGQLGLANRNAFMPFQVLPLPEPSSQIAAAGRHTLVLGTSGFVWWLGEGKKGNHYSKEIILLPELWP